MLEANASMVSFYSTIPNAEYYFISSSYLSSSDVVFVILRITGLPFVVFFVGAVALLVVLNVKWVLCGKGIFVRKIDYEKLTVPKHIAVIMDGNRRYGRMKFGVGYQGHHAGSETLVKFITWCQNANIQALTVYAFSTENWQREEREIQALMGIFEKFMHRIGKDAVHKNVRIRVLVSDSAKLNDTILAKIEEIERETEYCTGLQLSICVSYGSRHEIVAASAQIAKDVVQGTLALEDITFGAFEQRLLTKDIMDPDVILRTSGEYRLSNFLLYQAAYAELIFLDKFWPQMVEKDLHNVVVEYSRRKRRFGR